MPPVTKQQRDHVQMLQRRRDKLERIVGDWQGRRGGESWARAEITALQFALRCIYEVHPGLEQPDQPKETAA